MFVLTGNEKEKKKESVVALNGVKKWSRLKKEKKIKGFISGTGNEQKRLLNN